MSDDGLAKVVQRIAKLEAENVDLRRQRDEAERSAETYLMATQDDEQLQREITTLRDFINDVRLGIRDLSEYEAICDARWLDYYAHG